MLAVHTLIGWCLLVGNPPLKHYVGRQLTPRKIFSSRRGGGVVAHSSSHSLCSFPLTLPESLFPAVCALINHRPLAHDKEALLKYVVSTRHEKQRAALWPHDYRVSAPLSPSRLLLPRIRSHAAQQAMGSSSSTNSSCPLSFPLCLSHLVPSPCIHVRVLSFSKQVEVSIGPAAAAANEH